MLSPVEEILLFLMFFCLMIGIGTSIEKEDLKRLNDERRTVVIALGQQYLLMPLLALSLIYLANIPLDIAGIILLIAACPGGSTSNMFTYFSKGNVSLSLFLTFLTTSAALVMTPLILKITGSQLQKTALHIPIQNLLATLVFALFPVIIGFIIRLFSKKWALKVERLGQAIGYLSVAFMMLIWYPKIRTLISEQESAVLLSIGALSFLGILCSLLLAKSFKVSQKNARTLSFETGIQNAPLAFAIVTLNLPAEMARSLGWVPLLYGALSVGNAFLFTLIYGLSNSKEQQSL